MARPAYETRLLGADDAAIAQAAALLQAGEAVGMPTETVYGLAANALDAAAVDKIFKAKGRPGDNPLIVHIAAPQQLAQVAAVVPEEATRLAAAFWPGPLTLVLPKAPAVPDAVSAGLHTVGVRMPAHPVALALIRKAGMPLAAPSANRSGRPSPTTAAHVLADLNGRIPLVLDGGPAAVGVESTVLSLVGEPLVLRPGAVTAGQIGAVLGREVPLSRDNFREASALERPASPGMKYRHYAPKARLVLLAGSLPAAAEYVNQRAKNGVWVLCFTGEEEAFQVPALAYGAPNDPDTQAALLFAALRALDDKGAQTVYVRSPRQDGVGAAVYNRLLRAAAFQVIEV